MQRREPDVETDELAHRVIGAAIEVHRHLGPGFLEEVYEEALCIELALRQIPFERQKRFTVEYKRESVHDGVLDLLVDGSLVVELKAVREIAPIHRAKTIAYLKATNRQLALLLNFNVVMMKDGIERLVLT